MVNSDTLDPQTAYSFQSVDAYCEEIAKHIEDLNTHTTTVKKRGKSNWAPCEGGVLPTMARVQILVRIASRYQRGDVRQLAWTLYQHPDFTKLHLKTQRGGGDKPWTEKTCEGYLKDANISPSPDDAERLIAVLADIVEGLLRQDERSSVESVLAALNTSGVTVSECAKRVLGNVGAPPKRSYKPDGAMRTQISDSLRVEVDAVDPKGLDNTPLIDEARKISRFLASRLHVVHVAVLQSPPSSGRKMVVRHFISEFVLSMAKQFFKFGVGQLPVFACALDEMSPDEFVDAALRFYAPRVPSVEHADIETKINLIRAAAKLEAACVCISDVPPAYVGGLIRGAAQDYIGDVLFAILEGNPFTRLFLTTTAGNHAVLEEMDHRGLQVGHFKIDGMVRINRLSGASDEDGESSIQVPRINARLLGIATELIPDAPKEDPVNLRHRCRQLEQEQKPDELIKFIWGHLLTERQQRVVGLCAINTEGISLLDLERLIAVGAGLDPGFWDGRPPDHKDIAAVIQSTNKLMQVRRPYDQTDAAGNVYAILDDGWRRDFLRHYCADLPDHASLAYWLMARLAADESRKLRMSGDAGRLEARDLAKTVRTITALAASVRTETLRGWDELTVESPVLETLVLPPLNDRTAPRPDATLVYRFAFSQILRHDAQGRNAARASIGDHADRHLEVLLSFFWPYKPWMRWEDMVLESDPQSWQQMQSALTPAEIAALLNELAEAALRTRRFGILSAAVRIAEQAKSHFGGALPQSELMRAHRSEADAALLLGAMPGGSSFEEARMTGVVAAIGDLIKERFPRPEGVLNQPAARASGKFYGRLAEAELVAGRIDEARAALKAAREIESTVVGAAPPAEEMFPVLSSRGVRTQIRLLLAPSGAARWSSTATQIDCGHKLLLPEPVSLDAETMKAVRDLHLGNIRRLNSRGPTERLASHIDDALLSAAEQRLGEALSSLDVSGSAWHGVSIEVALELVAVRLRITLDAMLMMKRRDGAPNQKSLDAFAERRRQRGFAPALEGSSTMRVLGSAAEKDASALRHFTNVRMDGLRYTFAPYLIQAHLMTTWLRLLTLHSDRGHACDVMTKMKTFVDVQRQRIEETGCGLYLREADRLAAAMTAALED